jgi:hypothetical protein
MTLKQLMSVLGTPVAEVVEFDLASYSAAHIVSDPNDAQASLRINPNGKVERQTNSGAWNQVGTWIQGGGTPNDPSIYEVIASTTSGSLTTGPIGTGENLGSIVAWENVQTVVGNVNWVGDWTIRLDGGGADQDTADVTQLAAQVI